MTVCEVYIDESIEQVGDPILCVAGYVFRKSKAKEFGRSWSSYLKSKGLPHFHMTDCASNQGVFQGRDDCDLIARELIRRTRESTLFGFAVALDIRDYADLIEPQEGMRSAYSFALLACMQRVRLWRESTGVTGPTAFFFEAGHQHEREANEWLSWMLGAEDLRRGLGYEGVHAFIPKVSPGLHPADNLSWHWRLETVRSREKPRRRKTRADLIALWREQDMLTVYSRETLLQMKAEIEERAEKRAEARARRSALDAA